jgi:arginine decarboxylase
MQRFRFPIVIIDEDFRSENTSGLGIRALAQAIEKEGFEVLGATSYGDLSQFAQQQSRASAFILSIDDEEFTPGPELDPAVLNLRKFIEEIRFKNADIPIYIYGETRTSQHIPNDVLRELHGFIHMFEDTPEFVARHIIREAKSYLDGLAPPFFRALMDYAQDGSYSWHCPGHSGGVAFLKSPVGQMFHQFFGENMLRADVCNAWKNSASCSTTPARWRQRAQRGAHLQRRPLLLRHQRHQHQQQDGLAPHGGAGRRGGGRPQLPQEHPAQHHHDRRGAGVPDADAQPLRDHRPDPARASSRPETIRRKIAANPLLQHVDAATVKPRILTLTQSTYDGVLYNTETIKPSSTATSTRCTSTKPGCRTPPSTSSTAPSTRWARTARARARDGLRHAEHAQAAGRHEPGLAGAGAGLQAQQARSPPLQRGLPDAHLDLAAVRDHRLAATWPRR